MRKSTMLILAKTVAAAAVAVIIAPQTNPTTTFPLQISTPAEAKPKDFHGCSLAQIASKAFHNCVKHGNQDIFQDRQLTHQPFCGVYGVWCCATDNETGLIIANTCYQSKSQPPRPSSLNPKDGKAEQPPRPPPKGGDRVPPRGGWTGDPKTTPPRGPAGTRAPLSGTVQQPPKSAPSGTILKGGGRR